MACDKPTGDCTSASPCGNTGCCGETTAEPVLPRCQDVSLTPGTYTNATIVVNEAGCISEVTEGEPELYTPDDCCGGSGTGGGAAGPRGPAGPAGPAATITVNPVMDVGTAWSVTNTGTSSAAVLKFTAPDVSGGGSGSGTSGATGELNGFVFEAGLVKQTPSSLVTEVTATVEGEKSDLVIFLAVPDLSEPGKVDFTLNLDLLHADLQDGIDTLRSEHAELIEDLTTALANLSNEVVDLQTRVVALEQQVEQTAGEFGVDSGRLWNASSAAVTFQVFNTGGTQLGTINVNPNSTQQFPGGLFLGAGTYFIKVEGIAIGAHVILPD